MMKHLSIPKVITSERLTKITIITFCYLMTPTKISGHRRKALFQDSVTDNHLLKKGAVDTKYSTVLCFV